MSLFAPSNRIYEYDGSFEGLLTCFSRLIDDRIIPFDIVGPNRPQLSLFSENVEISTSIETAESLAARLKGFFGREEFERLKMTYLSEKEQKEMIAFRFIALACEKGKYAWCDLADPIAFDYERTWKSVYQERHYMLQFARFSKLEGGVFFSKVNPKANVVPIMMEHFARRFNTQPFMIYDEVRKIAGISEGGEWSLVDARNITIPSATEDDLGYQSMWCTFYDSICNEQRINPRVRMGFMPKRFWSNILEVSDNLFR